MWIKKYFNFLVFIGLCIIFLSMYLLGKSDGKEDCILQFEQILMDSVKTGEPITFDNGKVYTVSRGKRTGRTVYHILSEK